MSRPKNREKMSERAPAMGTVERLASGLLFVEGPAWIAEHGMLLFTDIPANVIYRWDDSGLARWCENAHFAIGLSRGRHGRLLACEHTTRSLTAYDIKDDGSVGDRTILASGLGDRVLNSTNDVICTSDGTVLFTDPPFGVRAEEGELHGYQQAMELPGCYVFAVGPTVTSPHVVIDDIYRPNGLCLSPDERTLYVSDSSERHHKVVAYDVGAGWAMTNPRDFAVMPVGVPDGMRVDADGNLWVGGGDGVYIYAPDGSPMGHVAVPEMVTNLEFGGADLRDVFITAVSSLYRVRAATPGGRASAVPS
ncbi:SMP-30/gluconolactonase/LRE family protein [Bauldia sp.]|uniref:SMP-30/gluconolactonase/LRE family protein n=1 Tax=Bauldia sp. TaxID=2575872 RepID=UPI003BAA22FF